MSAGTFQPEIWNSALAFPHAADAADPPHHSHHHHQHHQHHHHQHSHQQEDHNNNHHRSPSTSAVAPATQTPGAGAAAAAAIAKRKKSRRLTGLANAFSSAVNLTTSSKEPSPTSPTSNNSSSNTLLSPESKDTAQPHPVSPTSQRKGVLYKLFHFHDHLHHVGDSNLKISTTAPANTTSGSDSDDPAARGLHQHDPHPTHIHHRSSNLARSLWSRALKPRNGGGSGSGSESESDAEHHHQGGSGSGSGSSSEDGLNGPGINKLPDKTRTALLIYARSNSKKGRSASGSSSSGYSSSSSYGGSDSESDVEHGIFSSTRRGTKNNPPRSPQHQSSQPPPLSPFSDGHHPASTKFFKELRLNKDRPKRNGATSESSDHSDSESPTSNNHLKPPPMERATSSSSSTSSTASLSEKYGRKREVLGKGAEAVVRLCCPTTASDGNHQQSQNQQHSSQKYAVKEFRKRKKDETKKQYVKKLVSEFCISSSLHHENVVKTVDLIQDERDRWCVVMEFCGGGDLFGRISHGELTDPDEIHCYLKQLVSGVAYLHSMGVAHRDLKPENLLLDSTHSILKITDFGISEVFRMPFSSSHINKTTGLVGSTPYIAPEEWEGGEYDARAVDVWAVGIVYFMMLYTATPWKAASPTDSRFKLYLDNRKKGVFLLFDRMPTAIRSLMFSILDPNPANRATIQAVEEDEWLKGVKACTEEKRWKEHRHY
ncbi:serine/threonine-protein kinase HAL4/sat4, partial [Quaeritorhiza haematococci]